MLSLTLQYVVCDVRLPQKSILRDLRSRGQQGRPRRRSRPILIPNKILLGFTAVYGTKVRNIGRVWERVIILINQASYILKRSRTLFVGSQEKLKNPTRLPYEAEVRQIAGLTLLVGRSQNSHKSGLAIETHAPAVRRGFFRNMARPRLRVELPKRLAEAPEESVIFLDSALLLRVGGQHDERGVAAVFVGLRVVSKDGTGDSENIGALGAVLGGKELVDEIVVLPTLGCVDAGEYFLFVAEFGGEGIVGFALPGVFVEFLHNLISVRLTLGTKECEALGNKEVLVKKLGFAPIFDLGNADALDRLNLLRGLAHHVEQLSAENARASNGEAHDEDEQVGCQVFRVRDTVACRPSKRSCGICHDGC